MSKDLKECIIQAAAELGAFEKTVKRDILVRALRQGNGNQTLIEMICRKGLPKRIFVSPGIDRTLKSILADFAPVLTIQSAIDPAIHMSWDKSDVIRIMNSTSAPNLLMPDVNV